MEQSDLVQKVSNRFEEIHGRTPRIFRGPGRVNLIGEHTDYNEGFVMPFAIDRETIVAAAARTDRIINVEAMDVGGSAIIDMSHAPQKLRGNWIDYVEGTARSLGSQQRISGADLVFASSVPIGAGLSSSAALEVAVGFALISISDHDVNRTKLALAAQRAEHEFVGIRSGIMDQFASAFGRKGNAMLLDCSSMDIEYIPIATGSSMIAVCDTKVKHELASTEYNTRRLECEQGVQILRAKMPGITALREVSPKDLMQYAHLLPEPILSRCRHVVSENERTLAAAGHFKAGRLKDVGELMSGSHSSLRDDYVVSCYELDVLVAAAQSVEGVHGARMTGGGFGGCTVNLLEIDAFTDFREQVEKKYVETFGFGPDIYVFRAVEGASEIAAA